ncbi:Immunoglobulin I-set domain containing protein, partial [Aphelenchoides avenae]
FEVIVKGEPKPEVKFFKDSKEIKAADSHFQQSAEPDGTTRLTILAADAADAGTYRCEASNPAGTARSEAPLRVIPTGEAAPLSEVAPEFLQELKPVQANEGDKAVFECKVAGTPQPKVRWFKDGQELKDGDGCRIEALPDGTHRLILDNCKVDDQGNYRVEATNDAGSTSSKAPLTVKPSERLRLKKGLEDQNIPVGVKLQLSVEVEGKPKTVKWFKGHEEVSASAKTKIEKATDEEYRLVIEKADLSDTGAYGVVFTTDTESIESSCKVTVYEEAKKPSFKKGLTDQSVPKGSPVTLEVEVDGKPNQVKWYKDGKPVDEGRAKPEDLGNGRFALRIPEAGEEDFGRYTVRVINDAGEAESSANLSPK